MGGKMTFSAIIHREDEFFIAKCPEIGTVSQGKSKKEALSNLKEATKAYLEEFPMPSIKSPIVTTFEVAFGGRD